MFSCCPSVRACVRARDSTVLFADKPSAPQNLQVTEVTKSSVGLRWDPPESTGGMDVAQYSVERRDVTRGGAWVQAGSVDGATTKHVVDRLTDGNEYLFRVVAENKIGAGPPTELSQPVTAKLPYGTTDNHRPSFRRRGAWGWLSPQTLDHGRYFFQNGIST